jgi:hypothetical protein
MKHVDRDRAVRAKDGRARGSPVHTYQVASMNLKYRSVHTYIYFIQ